MGLLVGAAPDCPAGGRVGWEWGLLQPWEKDFYKPLVTCYKEASRSFHPPSWAERHHPSDQGLLVAQVGLPSQKAPLSTSTGLVMIGLVSQQDDNGCCVEKSRAGTKVEREPSGDVEARGGAGSHTSLVAVEEGEAVRCGRRLKSAQSGGSSQ